ncbi:histidine kinase [Isosphaera pallida ATCC 43644]|uniref:histidine kinase n=1 Tax=Isosphaera pallida (strain ATCC 43644 / DSM 9630 / IS1B) TaxID=575540 RepID=E8R2L6_ISOPI|nr:HAMP domain-containing sensor histidine kinase [Isosphaera pallida]ADV62516.1 histidine kinase [Isosphaera pallida ATCC 43644]
MIVPSLRRDPPPDLPSLRERLERLEGLPLRPHTARRLIDAGWLDPDFDPLAVSSPDQVLSGVDDDPAVALDRLRGRPELGQPLRLLAERPWWIAPSSRAAQRALDRLFGVHHQVARAIDHEARQRGLDDNARRRWVDLAWVHRLGLWALAAVDPLWIVEWLGHADPHSRRLFERTTLGEDLGALGRRLAERWHAPSDLVEVAWLHDQPAVSAHALSLDHPDTLAAIRRAVAIAETQGAGFFQVAPIQSARSTETPDDTSHHELMVWIDPTVTAGEVGAVNLAARCRLRQWVADQGLAWLSVAAESLEWADQARGPDDFLRVLAPRLNGLPGVRAIQIVARSEEDATNPPAPDSLPPPCRAASGETLAGTPRQRLVAWLDDFHTLNARRESNPPASSLVHLAIEPARRVWRTILQILLQRDRERRLLDQVLESSAVTVVSSLDAGSGSSQADAVAQASAPAIRSARFEALAEFAAGAGHELNNPLAVIQGRAQVLAMRFKTKHPDVAESLDIIVRQARRAHRMIRDLMFVARPPAPRIQSCRPDELAARVVEDLASEAKSRRVELRLVRAVMPPARLESDPDALRHLAEILLRNALEAAPESSVVEFLTASRPDELDWTIRDQGPGLDPRDLDSLLDPFRCGRQAGRGLGLGLPRAARILGQLQGQWHWTTAPGQGVAIHLLIPSAPPPRNLQ